MKIDGYTELQTLGSGASGSVVMARHDASGQLVAIKTLSASLVSDPAFLERFRNEAETLQRLRHPNITAVYGYIERPGEAAMTMELVNGVTLRRLIEQGPAIPEAALAVLRGSLLGLEHAHGAGIVHRDYKPENILVDGEGMSRLIDFGIAVRVGEAGGLAGTPRYMAPEQWNDGAATPQTDVYAATAVFFECVTGKRPFQATTLTELRAEHLGAPIPVEATPAAVRDLVARGLAKDPAQRYAGAGVFLAELDAAAAAAYGPDWLERGTKVLAAAALALAAFFPLAAGAGASASGTAVASTTLATTELGAAGVTTAGAATAGAGAAAWLIPGVTALLVAGALGVVVVKTDAFGLRGSTSSPAASTTRPAEVFLPPASPVPSAPFSPAAPTEQVTANIGPSLLVNGSADVAAGSPDGAQVVPIPGWTTTGNFTANSWDIGDPAFLQRSDVGPPDRGANYFAGGPNNPLSTATQAVELGLSDAQIAAGATYQLSAWLGGFAEQGDNMTVGVEFLTSSGASVGTATIGPTTNFERHDQTSLIYQATIAGIPRGAVKAVITMTATRVSGAYNDGYADDVAFEVRAG